MSILKKLQDTGSLKAFWDFRTGTLRDWSGNGHNASVLGGTPTWRATSAGLGIATEKGADNVSPGNPTGLQLSSYSIFAICSTRSRRQFKTIISKTSEFELAFNLGTLTVWSSGTGSVVSSPVLPKLDTPVMVGMTCDVSANNTALYVNGSQVITGTFSFTPQAGSWKIGTYNTSEWLNGSIQLIAIINGRLTSSQMSSLYQEWLNEPYALDTPHRHYSFPYKTLSPAQAANQGLVLDTDFTLCSNGKVSNYAPTSYKGTIVGNPVPASDSGMAFLGSSRINFDNIAEQNNATQATIITRIIPTEDSPKYIWYRIADSTHGIYLYVPSPGFLTACIANGTSSFGISASRCMYSGVEQEIAIVYDGTGATNTDRLKMYINGALVTLSYTNTIPATMANMAAPSFYYGGGSGTNTFNHTSKKFRCYSTALTAAQVRAEYLEGAKELLVDGRLRSDGSCPVSLTGITTLNTKVGGTIWETGPNTGAYAINVVQDSEQNRYLSLYCNSDMCFTPCQSAYGSWYLELMLTNAGTFKVMLTASAKKVYNDASQSGYSLSAAPNILFGKYTNGTGSWQITGPTMTVNKKMKVWISRTASGVFSLWACEEGGVWTSYGSWTDTSFTDGKYVGIFGNTPDAHFYNFMHFAGAMTPAEAIGLGLIDP